jgi:hypothetical protein
MLVAALENEGVACIFAIPGEETIFQFFCLAVFIHLSSRDRMQFSFRTNTLFCGRIWRKAYIQLVVQFWPMLPRCVRRGAISRLLSPQCFKNSGHRISSAPCLFMIQPV